MKPKEINIDVFTSGIELAAARGKLMMTGLSQNDWIQLRRKGVLNNMSIEQQLGHIRKTNDGKYVQTTKGRKFDERIENGLNGGYIKVERGTFVLTELGRKKFGDKW